MMLTISCWNGREIRFVHTGPEEWWAAAGDIARALGYADPCKAVARHCRWTGKRRIPSGGGAQVTAIISEPDVCRLIFRSRRPDAERFQEWACRMFRELHRAEARRRFRLEDREHQERAMERLRAGLANPGTVDLIKANTIANKAVSNAYGYPKMLKKNQMSPDMLLYRRPVLDDTVNLMQVNDSFGMGLSVSELVYAKYGRCRPSASPSQAAGSHREIPD